MLCLVAGSQWGMLVLAGVYLHDDRMVSRTSPEAVAGLLAIILALLVVRVRSRSHLKADAVFLWLAGFLVVACVGEVLRPDLRLGNVSTFISIGAFYLVGSAIGHDLSVRRAMLPLAPALLVIYSIWYLWILYFFMTGDLGFFGGLPGSDIARFQFRDGFSATEIPIYIGFQLPILICILATTGWLRIWAGLLLCSALALVGASASFGAMAATGLVFLVFLVSFRGLSWKAILLSAGVLAVTILVAMSVSQGLVNSVNQKILDFSVGEGVRALIYTQLVTDIVDDPLGIGKGRFVETNNFSWLGEGVYPHNNLLGIAAELGVPALVLFVLFLCSAVSRLARVALDDNHPLGYPARMFVAAVLAMMVYQQFRGLFQDTWVIREMYFWLGLAMGMIVASKQKEAAIP